MRYYFDAYTGQCKQFTYKGKGGNDNRFWTLALCKRECLSYSTPSDTTTTTTSAASRALKHRLNKPLRSIKPMPVLSANVCSLEADVGPCRALLQRFYYDNATGTCKRFFYGGCFGNSNNFFTLKLCQQACLNNAAPATTTTRFFDKKLKFPKTFRKNFKKPPLLPKRSHYTRW